MFELAEPGTDPIAGRHRSRELRVVGARRGRARPARRGLRPRRAHLLLPRPRRQHQRARRRRPDRRQLAAHRARDPDVRRGRSEDQHRDVPPRPARRGRLLHRVLRARLRRGVRAHGPRRSGPRRDRGRSAGAARAQALPRQVGRRALGGVQGAPRAGHDPRSLADRRRAAQADRRRGRVDPGPDLPDREHELAHRVRHGTWALHGRLVRRRADPPRRARHRAPGRRGSARSRICSGSSSRSIE